MSHEQAALILEGGKAGWHNRGKMNKERKKERMEKNRIDYSLENYSFDVLPTYNIILTFFKSSILFFHSSFLIHLLIPFLKNFALSFQNFLSHFHNRSKCHQNQALFSIILSARFPVLFLFNFSAPGQQRYLREMTFFFFFSFSFFSFSFFQQKFRLVHDHIRGSKTSLNKFYLYLFSLFFVPILLLLCFSGNYI